ncbi:hypothetical protein [Methylobrevis albus]|uniref:Uncharacterized protein n=1 Tax=Methylobrevis albus TaxID=2793297 RepID=A0A931I060_9HYPH|nr:hypothetical protein [Methylobrevis albus]MBH0236915.1 hypothetical protein [Methylobrevis albus]
MLVEENVQNLTPWIPLMSTIITAIVAPVILAVVQARVEHRRGIAPNIPQGSLGTRTPEAADVDTPAERVRARRNVFWLLLRRLIAGGVSMALCFYGIFLVFEADISDEIWTVLIILLIVLLVTIAVLTIINLFRIVLFGLRYLYVISEH